MKNITGQTALLTGASGGIGRHIAKALTAAGANLVVSDRHEDGLTQLSNELRGSGARVEGVIADLSDLGGVGTLIEQAERALGPIDIVVNNAGTDVPAAFTENRTEELTRMVDVNLTAPMLLTHSVLPGMLDRGTGHVVFISSAAAKMGQAYEGPYAATKAGLIALTQSLRVEYHHAPVGFSVVVPGFVEGGNGMYERVKDRGIRASKLLGTTTVDRIAADVVRAIERDAPEIVDMGRPMKPAFAAAQLAPRLAERFATRFGAGEMFRQVAEVDGRI